MKIIKRMSIFICLLCILSGCASKRDIEEKSIGVINYYQATPVLDFLKKNNRSEMFRETSRDDLGTWYLSSKYSYQENNKEIIERVSLKINRNTQKITGTYRYYTFQDGDSNEMEDIEYSIYYDEMGIHVEDDVEDPKVKERILNYKFAFEYIHLDDPRMKNYKVIDQHYSPKPSATYYITYKYNNLSHLELIQSHFPRIDSIDNVNVKLSKEDQDRRLEFQFNDTNNSILEESIGFGVSDEFEDLKTTNMFFKNRYQVFDQLYPTPTFEALLNKKAFENDITKGTWSIYHTIELDDEYLYNILLRVNKSNEEVLGSSHDENGNTDIDSPFEHLNFLFQKLDIDFYSYSDIKYYDEISQIHATIELEKEDNLYQQIENIFSEYQIKDNITVTFSISNQTHLSFGLGSPKIEISFLTSTGDKIVITEEIFYDKW